MLSRPEIPGVDSSVKWTFVKTDGSDVTIDISTEVHAQFNRRTISRIMTFLSSIPSRQLIPFGHP